MRTALDRTYTASLVAAGFFLVAILVLMLGEAVVRKLGGYIPGANELVGWSCAAAGFLALPAAFKQGDMVRVGALVDAAPATLRKALLLACLALAGVATGYGLWAVARYLHGGWRSEETTQGMIEIAVWIPQLSMLVGIALLLVAVLDEFVATLRAPAGQLRAEKAGSGGH